MMDLAFAYSALPCAVLPPTGQKPLMLSCLRAALTASIHFFSALFAKAFLALSDLFLLTILPVLLFVNVAFVKPPMVFSLAPLKTRAFASLPFPILLVFIAFMAFMAFIAFIAFMAFMAFIAFITFIAFMAFIVEAIANAAMQGGTGEATKPELEIL